MQMQVAEWQLALMARWHKLSETDVVAAIQITSHNQNSKRFESIPKTACAIDTRSNIHISEIQIKCWHMIRKKNVQHTVAGTKKTEKHLKSHLTR